MFFKMAKPQSLDFGLAGLEAQEEAGASQVKHLLSLKLSLEFFIYNYFLNLNYVLL